MCCFVYQFLWIDVTVKLTLICRHFIKRLASCLDNCCLIIDYSIEMVLLCVANTCAIILFCRDMSLDCKNRKNYSFYYCHEYFTMSSSRLWTLFSFFGDFCFILELYWFIYENFINNSRTFDTYPNTRVPLFTSPAYTKTFTISQIYSKIFPPKPKNTAKPTAKIIISNTKILQTIK